jgi:hypothetical protein
LAADTTAAAVNTMDDTAQTSTSQPTSLPSTQFSFKPPEQLPATKHNRRVSLPNSPRLSTPCSFRDDTGLDPSGKADGPSTTDFAKNKLQGKVEKKLSRKKWSDEETQMLVFGCEKVCITPPFPRTPHSLPLS